jgi:hypothetical protein
MNMKQEEDFYDVRGYVSDCFNYREGFGADSGYMRLTKLMLDEYDLTHNDVDFVVDEIEELVAKYIMKESQKFQDNE